MCLRGVFLLSQWWRHLWPAALYTTQIKVQTFGSVIVWTIQFYLNSTCLCVCVCVMYTMLFKNSKTKWKVHTICLRFSTAAAAAVQPPPLTQKCVCVSPCSSGKRDKSVQLLWIINTSVVHKKDAPRTICVYVYIFGGCS